MASARLCRCTYRATRLLSRHSSSIREEPSAFDIDDILSSFEEVTPLKDNANSTAASSASIDNGMSDALLKRRRDNVNNLYSSLGSAIDQTYSPRQQLHNPPPVSDVGIASLIASQAHLGHATSLWNSLTQPFIYGARNGIHIFNLDVTLAHLRRAANVVRGIAKNDGNIVFVGTRPGQKRIVVEAAKRASGYHVFDRWIPGTITNGKQVVGHGKIRHLVTRHEKNTQPSADPRVLPNSVVPDLIIILNPLENRNLLKECAKGRVPTIGIIDSDADPRWVSYSIPANDDSLRFASLVAGVLSNAAAEGRQSMAVPGWVQDEVKVVETA